jgi:hypothetical protein
LVIGNSINKQVGRFQVGFAETTQQALVGGVRRHVGAHDEIRRDGVALGVQVAGLFAVEVDAVAVDDTVVVVVLGRGFDLVGLAVAVQVQRFGGDFYELGDRCLVDGGVAPARVLL